nr:hypothetical protein [Tanacetum cinerariifolium]
AASSTTLSCHQIDLGEAVDLERGSDVMNDDENNWEPMMRQAVHREKDFSLELYNQFSWRESMKEWPVSFAISRCSLPSSSYLSWSG